MVEVWSGATKEVNDEMRASFPDDNTINLQVDGMPNTLTLDQGEYVEFESHDDFEVVGTDRLAVAQIIEGQHYSSV